MSETTRRAASVISAALGRFPSAAFQELHTSLIRLITNAPAIDVPILVLGETGAGKNWLAKILHNALQTEHTPFVHVNCNNLPKELAVSMLGGYETGSFTGATVARAGFFEQAADGSLYLDEIGDLPNEIQGTLHDILDERTVRRIGRKHRVAVQCRFLFATNKQLGAMVATGQFRSELFWRLSGFPIRLPPLRERMADIDALAEVFLSRHQVQLSDSASAKLQHHKWPGNVRELKHVLERAVLARDPTKHIVMPADITFDENLLSLSADDILLETIKQVASRPHDEVAAAHIAVALSQHRTAKEAARQIGLSERVISYELNHGANKELIRRFRALL